MKLGFGLWLSDFGESKGSLLYIWLSRKVADCASQGKTGVAEAR
jgi:hypothetical protein